MTTKHISDIDRLCSEIAKCTLCKAHLPDDVYPVIRADERAKILIAGQAPGRVVYETGLPFKDKSGDRLRDWLGVDEDAFYNKSNFAFLPMGLCFPGSAKSSASGKRQSGDLPPRPECAQTWHEPVIAALPNIRLIVTVGQYAMRYHIGKNAKKTLTQTVQNWRDYWPHIIPLPHPSPRNNIWLARNPWFEQDVVPALQQAIKQQINPSAC